MLTTDWRGDFRRLWFATAASQFGGAVGLGGLGLVAVLLLDAPAWQVSVLGAVSGLVSAALVLPLGPYLEFRTKRPVMVLAELMSAAALMSVPVLALLGRLTYVQLLVVGVVQVFGAVTVATASNAHLKGLVPADSRVVAQSRLDSTLWSSTTVGPMLGGVLVGVLGPAVVMAVDACLRAASAFGIRRMRTREPDPPRRVSEHRWRAELAAGWRHVLGHPTLRPLFFNALFFGGGVMLISTMLAVFMLRDLALPPWQFGLVLGLSGGAALVGSILAPRLVDRWGERRTILGAGVGRALWMPLLVFAPVGQVGLATVLLVECLLMGFAGIFNPAFAAHRMAQTPDALMARVGAAWSVSSKTVQPVCMVVGAVVAAVADVRAAIGVGAALVLISSTLLLRPFGRRSDAAAA